MALISFETLKVNYPDPKELDHDALFDELGWGDKLKRDPEYKNTCAIRMSYCLVKSGINIDGGFKILKGPHKNKRIETSQKKITKYLLNNTANRLGWAKALNPKQKDSFIFHQRQGIISFMEMDGYTDTSNNPSGHIDLAWVNEEMSIYGRFKFKRPGATLKDFSTHGSSYWDRAKLLWFWELP